MPKFTFEGWNLYPPDPENNSERKKGNKDPQDVLRMRWRKKMLGLEIFLKQMDKFRDSPEFQQALSIGWLYLLGDERHENPIKLQRTFAPN